MVPTALLDLTEKHSLKRHPATYSSSSSTSREGKFWHTPPLCMISNYWEASVWIQHSLNLPRWSEYSVYEGTALRFLHDGPLPGDSRNCWYNTWHPFKWWKLPKNTECCSINYHRIHSWFTPSISCGALLAWKQIIRIASVWESQQH